MRKAVNFRAVKKKPKIITVSFRSGGKKIIFQKTNKSMKTVNVRRIFRKRENT